MSKKSLRKLFSIKSVFILNHFFLIYLLDSKKNHNTQHSLLKLLESQKQALDQVKYIGAIFLDLSKAFDTLNHDL